MRITVTTLGTSSMAPTRHRSAPAVLIERAGEYILVDCGEGTQRQMHIHGKPRTKIRKVLLTHWHGDHVGGLGPLLQTLFHSQGAGDVELFGPVGTSHRFECLSCAMEVPAGRVRVRELEVPEVGVVRFWEGAEYSLECAAMRHGLPTLAYALVEHDRRHIDVQRAAALGIAPGPALGRLQRGEAVEAGGRRIAPEDVSDVVPGLRVAVVTDTLPNENIRLLATGADLLICEATYGSEHEELADTYFHMTAAQAAQLARESSVKQLVLTHFSQRYEDVNPVLEEARRLHADVVAAEDFASFTL